jgi:hypothetical protein
MACRPRPLWSGSRAVGGDRRGRRLRQEVYEAIRAIEQVGVLSWVNHIKKRSRVRSRRPQPDATTLRGAGSPAALPVAWPPGAARRLGGECGSGQIKPREPGAAARGVTAGG